MPKFLKDIRYVAPYAGKDRPLYVEKDWSIYKQQENLFLYSIFIQVYTVSCF